MNFGLIKTADGPAELVAGFSIARAAAVACMSESHIRSEIRNGKLKAKKRGRRVIILADALSTYLNSSEDWTPGEAPTAAIDARRKAGAKK